VVPSYSTNREGESPSQWTRSGRTFAARGGWHVKTREGHPLGPYPSEFDAAVVAALLIAQLQQAPNLQACRRIIYNFRHDDRFKIGSADEVLAPLGQAPVRDVRAGRLDRDRVIGQGGQSGRETQSLTNSERLGYA
jgi:Domain of unknown function (DUF6316)